MPPEQVVAALVLSSLIGVTLGTFGSGGSILALPVLVYVARVPTAAAVGMSLAIVAVTAAVGCVVHAREYGIDGQAAAVLATTGAVGAFFGSGLTSLVGPDTLMLIFGGVMVAAGLRMARPVLPDRPVRPPNVIRSTALGLGIGVLTGFLGVGGGFMVVPALVLLLNVDPRRAVPTSLAVITFNAVGGFLGHLGQVRLDWVLTAAFLLTALAGLGGGVAIVHRVSAAGLRRAFAVGLVLLGAGILFAQAATLAGVLG